jgi:DNA helicase-2/ATP-dependent DNA helicase PcrA
VKYLDGLNDAQKRAVLAKEGPISVLAGAGSGKTRVLTTRIYHLVREGVPAREILAVTFTNKAAREMRERVRVMLGGDGPVPFVATFHGLGRELLESYGKAIGIPRFFSVYDRDDSEKAIGAALKSLDVDAKELSPRAVLGRISRHKGEGMRAQEFYEKHGRASFGGRIAAEAWLRYEKTLKEEKALDFDDLIALPVRLLEEHVDIRALAQDRWKYIHIDEYQDTNALQGRLANMLAAKHRNLFVVGDIDQTIYTWRGATIENLLEFDKEYPESQTIILERNYRSTKNLVDAANAIIEKNKNRKEKYSTTERGKGEPIVVHMARNAEDEARWIAAKIRELLKSSLPEDIAILFRTNFQSRALEEGLLHAGVPYKLLGTHFFARKEVKDALAWVRLAMDPSREVDKLRAAASPPRGLGKITLGKLAAGNRSALRAGELAKVEAFEELIGELSAATDSLIPSEFVKLVIEKSGMKRALFEEGNAEDRERFENVEELASVAARYDASSGKGGIAAFLAEAALASDQDEMDQGSEKRGVMLMTVHAAKGLEFGTVFVSGMEEGLFPHQGMGNDTDRDEEEERRLFYVAMTRAKERLYLTLARVRKIYGSDFASEPSSFIADIDSSLLLYDETEGNDIYF